MSPLPKTPTKTRAAWIAATWFGCGYAPSAPGTAGSAAAALIAGALGAAGFRPLWFLPLSAILLYPGIIAADIVARESVRKDPGFVVVDEVLGQWVTFSGAGRLGLRTLLVGFALFRLFDVWKPFPVRSLERLPGGAGIVLDDIMAGAYGALVLLLLGWFNLN